MKVSFNNTYSNHNNFSFSASEKKKKPVELYKEKKQINSKTKKLASECTTVAVGLAIIYFAVKRNFKYNRIKSIGKQSEKLSQIALPEIKLQTDKFKDFLKV